MSRTTLSWLVAVGLLLASLSAQAQNTLMARSPQGFEVAMQQLQTTLKEYGYAVAHIQKCDGGMTQFGYNSDFYRVVFFGKIEETRRLSKNYPQLVPYLPLKILLFAENDETVFVALNPLELGQYYQEPELLVQFMRWHNDLRSMFDELHDSKPVVAAK